MSPHALSVRCRLSVARYWRPDDAGDAARVSERSGLRLPRSPVHAGRFALGGADLHVRWNGGLLSACRSMDMFSDGAGDRGGALATRATRLYEPAAAGTSE